MTIPRFSALAALIEEAEQSGAPIATAYAYVLVGKPDTMLFAAFPVGQDDDMDEAPEVDDKRMLYAEGEYTAEGQVLLERLEANVGIVD